MERLPISVCMATYNGSKFIKLQLDSILKQLLPGDELIIIDDKSKDNTVELIQQYNALSIRLIQNEKNVGHVRSFEKALTLANNSFICFSDQDDEWLENRLDNLYGAINEKDSLLVSSNYNINNEINTNHKFLSLKASDSNKNLKNIINIFLGKAPYYGCTMMIKKELKKIILPIPEFVEAHDLWMAMAANVAGSNYLLDSVTLNYRIHNNNVSLKKRSLYKKIKTRVIFFISLVKLFLDIKLRGKI